MPEVKIFNSLRQRPVRLPGSVATGEGRDKGVLMIEYFAGTNFHRRWVLQDEYGQPLPDLYYASAEVIIRTGADTLDRVATFTVENGELAFTSDDDELFMFLVMDVGDLGIAPGEYLFQCIVSLPAVHMIESTHLIVYAKHNEVVEP